MSSVKENAFLLNQVTPFDTWHSTVFLANKLPSNGIRRSAGKRAKEETFGDPIYGKGCWRSKPGSCVQWLQTAGTIEKTAGSPKVAKLPDCHLPEILGCGLLSFISKSESQSPLNKQKASVSDWVGSWAILLAVFSRSPPTTNDSCLWKIFWPLPLSGPLATCINIQGGNLIHFSIPKLERLW